jgi:uncharacterized protein YodC (DUF2158 family)
MKIFKIGDIVQLKSGGPKMTISLEDLKVSGTSTGKVHCEWFINGEVKTYLFNEEVLTLAT